MHRGSVRPLAVAVLVLIASGAAVAVAVQARMPRGTDAEQIRAVLKRGEQAVEAQELGAVLTHISPDYRDPNGFTRDTVRFGVGRTFREMDEIDVHIPEPSLRIQVAPDGRQATVTGQVYLLLTPHGGGVIPRDFRLTLQFQKEPSRIFGIFPTQAWRVVSAEGYGAVSDVIE